MSDNVLRACELCGHIPPIDSDIGFATYTLHQCSAENNYAVEVFCTSIKDAQEHWNEFGFIGALRSRNRENYLERLQERQRELRHER